MPISSVIERLARAFLEGQRAKLGIPAEEQAAQTAADASLLRRAQAAKAMQELGLAPAAQASEIEERRIRGENLRENTAALKELREAQAAASRALASQRLNAPTKTIERTVDLGDKVEYVYTDGTRETRPKGVAPRAPTDRPEPGRLSPLVDDKGNVIATFHNVTGEVRPIKGAPAPGAPGQVGGTGVRKTPLGAQERKDEAGLELALEGAQSLRRLLTVPEVQDTIGFVGGRLAALKRGTIGASPEVQELFRTSDRMAEFLLRALSGAQINEQEYTRLRNLIPNPRTHISQFKADLDLFEAELKSTLAKRFGTDTGPAAPAGAPAPLDPAVQRILDMIRSRNATGR